ncbi:MAG: phage protease [Cypionkella sp.]
MPLPNGGVVPDWVHLLPAGGGIRTFDGRGPYHVTDAASLIAASMEVDRLNGDLPIDENHSTDLKANAGGEAPARGWIKELQARADGIWGRVEWTGAGKALVADRSYRGISPVFTHSNDGQVLQLLRAALTNQPNLRGLAAINQENPLSFIDQLRTKRGLPATATEAEVLADVPEKGGSDPAMQSAMAVLQSTVSQIATAVGADATNLPALLAAVSAKTTQATAQPPELLALQAELVSLGTELIMLKASGQRKAAETVVDAAIAEARVGIKPQRDRFIAMHMADPSGTEALIAGLPALGAGGQITQPANPPGEVTSLNAAQVNVAQMMGIDAAKYLETLKADGRKEIR